MRSAGVMKGAKKTKAGKPKVKASPVQRAQGCEEIAELQKVHVNTVRLWIGDGCPASKDGAEWLLNDEEVNGWLLANNRKTTPGRPPKPKAPAPEGMDGDKDYWLARKYKIQCLKEEGELVDKQAYRQLWIGEVQTIKGKCRGLGASLAPGCVGLDAAEIQGVIDGRVEQVFRELAE